MDKKENKNTTLLHTLMEIKKLKELNEKELFKLYEDISNTINLNSLRRGIDNVCIVLSNPKNNIKLDKQQRLELIYNLLNNQSNISKNVRIFRKNKPQKDIKEIEIFIENTTDTLKIIKEYQPQKVKVQKENLKDTNKSKTTQSKEKTTSINKTKNKRKKV